MMLPRTMRLRKQTEENLKKLKSYTGVTPNVSARVAFFRSVESGFRVTDFGLNLDGTLVLDKVTWLGELELVTETLLRSIYPDLNGKELENAWAQHVDDGIANIKNMRSLKDLLGSLS